MSIARVNPPSEIEQFKDRLISSGIALEYQMRGCSPEELEEIEKLYGKLPISYRQILSLIGHRAGKLVDRGEFDFYVDQLLELNIWIRECEEETLAEGEAATELPSNVFFICSRYGDSNTFVFTNTSRDDSPIFLFHDNGDIEEIRPSVWDWIRDFEKDAKYWIRLGVR